MQRFVTDHLNVFSMMVAMGGILARCILVHHGVIFCLKHRMYQANDNMYLVRCEYKTHHFAVIDNATTDTRVALRAQLPLANKSSSPQSILRIVPQ